MFQDRIFSHLRRILGAATLVLAVSSGAAFALPEDDLLAARDAYNARNASRLHQYAQRLQGQVLEPFARYWELSLKLDEAKPEEVEDFINRYADSFLSDRLRSDWLRVLGKQRNWDLFSAEYPRLINEDTEVTCYALQARHELFPSDASSLQEAKRLWFNGTDLPSNCNALFESLVTSNMLSVDDVFARLRLTLELGNVSVARYVTQYLPTKYQAGVKPLEAAAENPQRFLEKKHYDIAARGGRELVLFAIYRIARTDPALAQSHWEKLKEHFSAEDQAYEWGQLAFYAARQHDPAALSWYAQAAKTPLSDLQLGWKARAALLARNWQQVLDAIGAMTPEEQRQAMWQYWKARALKALGRTTAANQIFAVLSRDPQYYGQLALEEMGAVITPVVVTYKATEDEIKAVAARPGIQRAVQLYQAGLRGDGAREWRWAIRQFDDKQLLAAAEWARRNDLYDRAIYTADRTQQLHDFSLRFPAPHRDVMLSYTRQLDLDDAWVYGLIRQESRFVQVAKSNVGASGLMQLMPTTAKWVAKKLGLKGFHHSLVHELDTNIALGTYYLKHVYDLLDNSPVLATAAYNAGPARARRWQGQQPMEGTIYIESIPFTETRDYVKKVMSNASHYAEQFGDKLTSLKQRIGTISGKAKDTPGDYSDEP
jgi:soluble lytic murein transglycosylase